MTIIRVADTGQRLRRGLMCDPEGLKLAQTPTRVSWHVSMAVPFSNCECKRS